MKKRIFSRVLALFMALAMLSTTALADVSFDDLQEAINGAETEKTATEVVEDAVPADEMPETSEPDAPEAPAADPAAPTEPTEPEDTTHVNGALVRTDDDGTNYFGYGWSSVTENENTTWYYAIEAHDEQGNRYVVLLDDVSKGNGTASGVVIDQDGSSQKVTIDMQDHNITGNGEGAVITVKENAELNLNNGTITGGEIGIDVLGTLFLDNVMVSQNGTGIKINKNGKVTFNGDKNAVNGNGKNLSGTGKVTFKLGNQEYQVDVETAETLLAGEGSVAAHGTTQKGNSWILAQNGTVIYTGSGDTNNQLTSGIVSDVLKAAGAENREVTGFVIPEGITTIGQSAFFKCSNVSSIAIPNTVTSIGGDAFKLCTSLTEVKIPNTVTTIGNQVFESCNALKSIDIPSSVKTLGSKVFFKCSSLTELVIPETVTSCGELALWQCTSLKHVEILGAAVVPSMSNCKELEYVKIGEKVTAISDSAFYQSKSLKTLVLPEKANFKTIGNNAFNGCTNLEGVITIPEGVETIGAYAFSGCSGISAVKISNTVTAIDKNAFAGCVTFTSIDIPSSVKNIGGGAFASCSGITEISIPEGVTTIGESAFSGCTSLTKATVPTSVTTVGKYVFNNTSVKSVWVYAGGEKDCTATVNALTASGVANNRNVFAVTNEGTTLYRYGNVISFSGNDSVATVNDDGSVSISTNKMDTTSNNSQVATSVEFSEAVTVVVGSNGTLTIPASDVAVTVGDTKWAVDGEGEITLITVGWNPTFYQVPSISGSSTFTAPNGDFSAIVSNGASIGGDGTINAKTGEVTFTDKDDNTVVITGSGVKVETTGTVFIPWSGSVKDDNGITSYPGSATMKDGQIVSKGSVTFENNSGAQISVKPAEVEEGEELNPVTVDTTTGVITVPTGGNVSMNDGKNVVSYPDGATVDRQGSAASNSNVVEYAYEKSSGTVTTPEGSKITVGSDGTIAVPAGSTIAGVEYPYGATILPDGIIVANLAPFVVLPDFTFDSDTAGTGDGDDTTTIDDEAIPLAGLISRAQLVSYLYAHEGSPDGEDAEDEYALAWAWGVENEIVDEGDDPEEIVTVAILREIMTAYAKFLDTTFDVVIEEDDDMPVMNCDEILAEFYASLEDKAA